MLISNAKNGDSICRGGKKEDDDENEGVALFSCCLV